MCETSLSGRGFRFSLTTILGPSHQARGGPSAWQAYLQCITTPIAGRHRTLVVTSNITTSRSTITSVDVMGLILRMECLFSQMTPTVEDRH